MNDPDRIVRLDLSEYECTLVSLAVAFYVAAIVYGRGAFDEMLAALARDRPAVREEALQLRELVFRIEAAMKQ